ncbi:hypothetical protein [Croceicoccus gelatinilyticus]|uniref:hypothetical protein n=1 Tax=Croceicoccus gelatinilyticus TaxID=2835536 RepID=UPI001BCD6E01|nr:hypothetical protein [Croceicoccus gelatinilyticus]MBS7669439.1 hypothetical protein [Croceicoccus gelatinilyticus]
MAIDLSDARACLARAQKHYAELRGLTDPGALWRIREAQDTQSGEWFGCLDLNRPRLIEIKPVIADCATNTISALDNVAGAIARANGEERLRWLYYPLGLSDEDFAKACKRYKPALGDKMVSVLEEYRRANRHNVPHVEAAKEVSYSGKHWELMLAAGSAHGVAVNEPGKAQRIFQIAGDAFAAGNTVEYYRGAAPLPAGPRSIVIGLSLDGLDEGLPKSPDSIFECAFRFVEGAIQAVEDAAE